jgi:hypothetical protein
LLAEAIGLCRENSGELLIHSTYMPFLSFRAYLSKRTTRYTPASAFVAGLIRDEEFVTITSREELDAFLARRNIRPNGRIFAHAVWKSYLAAKARYRQRSSHSDGG